VSVCVAVRVCCSMLQCVAVLQYGVYSHNASTCALCVVAVHVFYLCVVAVRVLCVLLQFVSFMRSNNTPSELPCSQTHSAATHTDTTTHSDCNTLTLQHTLTATHSYYNTLCNTHLLERPARKRIPFVHLGFIDLTCFKAPC